MKNQQVIYTILVRFIFIPTRNCFQHRVETMKKYTITNPNPIDPWLLITLPHTNIILTEARFGKDINSLQQLMMVVIMTFACVIRHRILPCPSLLMKHCGWAIEVISHGSILYTGIFPINHSTSRDAIRSHQPYLLPWFCPRSCAARWLKR